jgi:hypothetical protein
VEAISRWEQRGRWAITKLVNPVPLFLDGRGALLDAGYIYIGTSGNDPEVLANQIDLFWDKALTIPADQPLRTLGGAIVRGYNFGFVYFAETDYSITIRDADSNLVDYVKSAFDLGGVSYQPFDTDLTAIAALATASFGRGLLVLADAAALRSAAGLGTAALLDETTAAQFRADTAGKVLTTDKVWGAAASVALAQSGGNVAIDLNTGLNFSLAMTGTPWTLSNPTNGKDGQSGKIEITQDATGSRLLGYGTNWLFANATDPILSTAANARDVLFYEVLADGKVLGSLVKALG